MIFSENQFDIWGLRNSVSDAHKFILNRLHKYNQAATLSEYIKWKYEDPPNSDNWKEFALLNNFELNSSFKVCRISTVTAASRITQVTPIYYTLTTFLAFSSI